MEADLKKDLGLLDIFCVATGAMISSGLFILPGMAFAKAGPAVVLSYMIAGLFCIPTVLSMAELTTAMPKAGGDYFYIMRGFGPLLGTLAGFSTWLSLSLKGAFALIGMGAYLRIVTHAPLEVIAVLCCVFFVVLNLVGAKEAGRFQVALVGGLLAMLLVYVLLGVRAVKPSNLSPFVSEGVTSVLACASFVFISYGGITKVAALAEETRNPGRNLPLGMILSLLVGWMLYASVILVTVGVLESEGLKTTLTPISDGAHVLGGRILEICISVGALLAFISTANAGVLTASRYPLGMSRDKLIPDSFRRVGRRSGTPYIAILFTGSCMILSIVFLRIELLVKVASTVMILLYVLANLTLVLFRESKIASYRPKFRSPFYPYPQVIGILGGIFLLIEMGTYIVFLTIVFLLVGFGWYRLYARARARQDSALIHMVERLVAADKALASDGLLTELKDIVMERDGVIRDRFHQLVEKAGVLDDDRPLRMEDFFRTAADLLAQRLDLDAVDLYEKFVERENTASTVVADGLAIPHVVIEDARDLDLILVRARAGIIFPGDKVIHTAFVLVGSSGDRVCHLHILAAIAQITQNPDFSAKWLDATDIDDLRNLVLLAERTRSSARKS